MTTALISLAVLNPFALTAVLIWTARRAGILRWDLDQFRVWAPMAGRFDSRRDEDRDYHRVQHDLDAIRTRFEEHPVRPASGVLGERR
ncbi:hypothetical protein MDOR_32730 [Mycolicibacterium doricum]|uniref:Uncharacterized protein n=1 Tax=Mycolicibacterium doricum TaxID=126673 RepID=A0A1X1TIK9_9MYCO|nr:hypothetical protein [Mycolicibacterium doricum]MCV7268026.1 hypothetical protein [Mycolicibacterium doricum]ORV44414.1 hypothetical protein AWC01_03870 [Mycolicibacterium doricum]BBZ09104.1 hypothetical protein MDOR_32730 [Mycolicibacterium doricum]